MYDIKITESLKSLLDYYLKKFPDNSFIFLIIVRESLPNQFKDIRWERKRYNKKLKDVATCCGIEQNLTSYVSRHSFATQAMLQNVPVTAISGMLGHSSLKTTETYLKGFPADVLNKYNSKIVMT